MDKADIGVKNGAKGMDADVTDEEVESTGGGGSSSSSGNSFFLGRDKEQDSSLLLVQGELFVNRSTDEARGEVAPGRICNVEIKKTKHELTIDIASLGVGEVKLTAAPYEVPPELNIERDGYGTTPGDSDEEDVLRSTTKEGNTLLSS